jgi:SAM-dependent methyltransferase
MDGGYEAEREKLLSAEPLRVPEYLSDTYTWAYLTPASLILLDNRLVLSVILWGNLPRLVRTACEEVAPGQRVLQAASVYGNLSTSLARAVGPDGRLSVIDIAPLQVAHCRRKLAQFPHADVRRADAAVRDGERFDGVCCFFLLHEVPDDTKHAVVDSLLGRVPVGGKVVFVDYHRPARWHPLRGVMSAVFHLLEPFAFGLINRDIESFSSAPDAFAWRKATFFGGLYQKVVATRVRAD